MKRSFLFSLLLSAAGVMVTLLVSLVLERYRGPAGASHTIYVVACLLFSWVVVLVTTLANVVLTLVRKTPEERKDLGLTLGMGLGMVAGAALCQLVVDAYTSVVMGNIMAQQREVALAVRAFQDKEGELPESVDALIPGYLARRPVMPDYCTQVELASYNWEWSLMTSCNQRRAPVSPDASWETIGYPHHRVVYKSANGDSSWGMNYQFGSLPDELRHLNPSMRLDHVVPHHGGFH